MFTINAKCAQSANTINVKNALNAFRKGQKSISAAIKLALTFWAYKDGAARDIFAPYGLTNKEAMKPEVWSKNLHKGLYAKDGSFLHFAMTAKKDENGKTITKKGKAVQVLALVPLKGWSVFILAELLEQSANYDDFAAMVGKTSEELKAIRANQTKNHRKAQKKQREEVRKAEKAQKEQENAIEKAQKAVNDLEEKVAAFEKAHPEMKKGEKARLAELKKKLSTAKATLTRLQKKAINEAAESLQETTSKGSKKQGQKKDRAIA